MEDKMQIYRKKERDYMIIHDGFPYAESGTGIFGTSEFVYDIYHTDRYIRLRDTDLYGEPICIILN